MSRRSWGRRLEDFLFLEVVPLFASLLMRLLYASMRIRHLDYHKVREFFETGKNAIFAFWHGQLLMMPFISPKFPPYTRAVLISQHRDGEMIARIMRRFGYLAVRGSKSRGGFGALRLVLRVLREGKTFVITPDGPRGPRHIVKPNVIQLAKATGLPIIPMIFGAKSFKAFASWDAFVLPYPFTRGVFIWGDPIWVSAAAPEEEIEAARKKLEQTLNDLTAKAQEIARQG